MTTPRLDLGPLGRMDRLIDHDALRDITPVVVSVVPFAAIIGVTIGQADRVPAWAALLAGPLLYAGSAQLAALTLLESGAGDVGPAVMAALVITHLTHGQGVHGFVLTDVLAAIVATGVAWWTGKVSITVVAGVAAAGVLRLVF